MQSKLSIRKTNQNKTIILVNHDGDLVLRLSKQGTCICMHLTSLLNISYLTKWKCISLRVTEYQIYYPIFASWTEYSLIALIFNDIIVQMHASYSNLGLFSLYKQIPSNIFFLNDRLVYLCRNAQIGWYI